MSKKKEQACLRGGESPRLGSCDGHIPLPMTNKIHLCFLFTLAFSQRLCLDRLSLESHTWVLCGEICPAPRTAASSTFSEVHLCTLVSHDTWGVVWWCSHLSMCLNFPQAGASAPGAVTISSYPLCILLKKYWIMLNK